MTRAAFRIAMPIEEAAGCLSPLVDLFVELLFPLFFAPFRRSAPAWQRVVGLALWGGVGLVTWWAVTA